MEYVRRAAGVDDGGLGPGLPSVERLVHREIGALCSMM